MKPYKKNIQRYKTKYRKLLKKGVSQQTFVGYFSLQRLLHREDKKCLDQKNCQT